MSMQLWILRYIVGTRSHPSIDIVVLLSSGGGGGDDCEGPAYTWRVGIIEKCGWWTQLVDSGSPII